MCLLMVTMGEIPKRDFLYNAAENNPDGFGFAVNHGDRIITGRSMKHERLIERFIDEMGKSDNPVGMFHSRYTTHGATTLENNHPFRVDGRHDTVLAHNGMLPITPRTGDTRSDTRIFAEDILGSVGLEQLDDKQGFKTLEEFAYGSKIAILTNAPELRDQVYILNESDGHWDGSIWWSNSSYKYSYSYKKPYSSKYYYSDAQAWGDGGTVVGGTTGGNWWNDDEYEKVDNAYADVICGMCAAVLREDDFMGGVCNTCDSCIDCEEHINLCMCYTPAHASKKQIAPLSDGWEA